MNTITTDRTNADNLINLPLPDKFIFIIIPFFLFFAINPVVNNIFRHIAIIRHPKTFMF